MSASAITNVHVDCVSYDGQRAAAGFTLGEHDYHIWFNPKIGRGSAEAVLHKNFTDRTAGKHQACNPKAAANAPLLAEMWRQIEERRLISQALADRAMDDLIEQAERDNNIFDQRLAKAAPAMLAMLRHLYQYAQLDGLDRAMIRDVLAEAKGEQP